MELKPENKLVEVTQPETQPLLVDESTIEVPVQEVDVQAVKSEEVANVVPEPLTADSLNVDQLIENTAESSVNPNAESNVNLSASLNKSSDQLVSSGSSMSISSAPLSQTQTPSNAQRPGERLRQARLLKNRDLKDIATDLNISERLLTAIEADDYKSLPEPAFIRGYLRGYGRLLGIDSDALIAQFNEIYTSATGLSSNHSLENSPLQQLAKLQTRSRKSKRWMWWLLVPVALIILFLVLRPVVKKVMGPSASENAATQTVVLNDSSQYGSSTTGSALPQVNSTPLAPLPPVATTQSATDQLVLTLSKASDVTVQDSTGKTLVSGTQGTDKPLTLEGSSPFSITLSDAASVKLSLNNEQIDLSSYTVDGHASFRLSR